MSKTCFLLISLLGFFFLLQGDLVFYVNSFAQGVAATGLPSSVYAMVDLYGKCVQATVMNRTEPTSLPRPLLSKIQLQFI